MPMQSANRNLVPRRLQKTIAVEKANTSESFLVSNLLIAASQFSDGKEKKKKKKGFQKSLLFFSLLKLYFKRCEDFGWTVWHFNDFFFFFKQTRIISTWYQARKLHMRVSQFLLKPCVCENMILFYTISFFICRIYALIT